MRKSPPSLPHPETFGFDRSSEYENGFYLTASVDRFSKFVSHLDLFRRSSGVSGEIVECGVFKGASLSRFIKFRALLENTMSRRIIAFDSFGYFPEADDEDREKLAQFQSVGGEQGLSQAELQCIFEELELNTNVELIEGDVRSTVPGYCARYPELRISLLNIDVDHYEATAVCLNNFYPHVTPGGIILLDDHGAFPGASRAIDEFFSDLGLKIEKLPYAFSHAFVEKP